MYNVLIYFFLTHETCQTLGLSVVSPFFLSSYVTASVKSTGKLSVIVH